MYIGKYRRIGSSWGINIPQHLADAVGIKTNAKVLIYVARNSAGIECLALEPAENYAHEEVSKEEGKREH